MVKFGQIKQSEKSSTGDRELDLQEITTSIRKKYSSRQTDRNRQSGFLSTRKPNFDMEKVDKLFKLVVEKSEFQQIADSKENIKYLPLFLRYMAMNEFKSAKSKMFIEQSVKLIRSVIQEKGEPDIMWLG